MTRSSSLIWAHAPDQNPLAASVYRLCHASLQVAASPCWELAFPDVISSIFLWVLGPVPRRAHPVHSLVSSRTTSASPQSKQVRRAGTSTMTATSKCLYKINCIFFAKILDDLFHILDQMSKAGICPKFDPFIFHKTPQYLNQIQFGRILRKVENR
jgi:hypothetical protein